MHAPTHDIVEAPLFAEVVDCMWEDDAVGMIVRLQELDKEFPQHPLLYYYSARSREIMGNRDEAFERFSLAARLGATQIQNDNNNVLRYFTARSYYRLCSYFLFDRKLDAAENAIRQALHLLPNFSGIGMALADIHMRRGDVQGAIDVLYRGYQQEPDVQLLYTIGRTYSGFHHPAEAARMFRRVVQQEPGNPDHWISLGKAYADHGDFKPAAAALERGVALQSEQAPWVINTYAYILEAAGRSQEAREQALLAVSLVSDASAIWDTLAYAYIGTGEYDKAIEAALKAIELDWDEHEGWYHLGVAYARSNRPAKAREVFTQLIRLDLAWAGMLAKEMGCG